jgi:hypothetical protein
MFWGIPRSANAYNRLVATTPNTKLAELAAVMRDDASNIALRMAERLGQEVPDWLTRYPDLAKRGFEMTRGSIEAEFAALVEGGEMPETAPPADREYAKVAAQLEIPLHVVIDAYHRGASVQWEMWSDLVRQRESDPDEQRDLFEAFGRFFMNYGTWIMGQVGQLYEREREARVRSGEQRRVHLVREVLSGRDGDLSTIGYDLSGQHLGLVLWGPGTLEAAESLAAALGRRLLFLDVLEDTSWAWLGGHRPLSAERRRKLAGFEPPEGTRLAVGVEGAGPEGFRETHDDAVEAQRGAWAGTRAVTFFDHVALEALAGRDERAARRFLARELRGIDGEDARSKRLRDTLTTYFAHGGNAAATAKALDIHEQTVAQRLTAVEERTGRAILNRRAELETALRLRRYFAARRATRGARGAAGPAGDGAAP